MSALRSITTFVLHPATRAKWHAVIAADVVVPKQLEALWYNATAALSTPLAAQRLSPRHLGHSQVASIASSIRWSVSLLQTAGTLLLLRVDLVLKAEVPACLVGHCQNVRVPFDLIECDDDNMAFRALSDAILWIPAAAFAPFDSMLLRGNHQGHSLHSMHMETGLETVDVMLPGFQGDTNTDADWNPLFYIIGREHATLQAREEKLHMNPNMYSCNSSKHAFRAAQKRLV